MALALTSIPSIAASQGNASVQLPGGEQRVTLRLRDMALADALRMIGARARVNVSVSPDVKGTVDLDFYNEPLNRVMETLIGAHNLQVRRVGNTVVVSQSASAGLGGVKVYQLNFASAAEMKKLLGDSLKSAGINKGEDQIIADARSNAIIASGNEYFQAQVQRLISRLDQAHAHKIFRLNFIAADEAAKLLADSLFVGAKDTGVKFVPILRENSLMVVASPEDLKLAEEILTKVDRPLRQVLIEAKLIELNGTSSSLLGVTFDARTGTLQGGWDPTAGLNVNYNPLQQALSQLQVRLNALLRDNKARLLASPSLVAMDSKESKIEITDDIIEKVQFETTTNPTATLTRQNVTLGSAGITLAITPKINPDGYISMKVEPTISFIRETVRGNQNEILATLKSQRRLNTPEVRVKNGETLIIGGLNQERTQETVDKVPLLGDIPLLGNIFRRTDKSKVTTELVVLLTPKLIPDGRAVK